MKNSEEQYSKQLQEFKKRKHFLYKAANRRTAPLIESLICTGRANRSYLKDALGYDYGYAFRFSILGDIFLSRESEKEERDELKKMISKDDSYFTDYIDSLKATFKKINSHLKKSEWTDSKKELRLRLDMVAQSVVFLTSFTLIEEIITSRVNKTLEEKKVEENLKSEYLITLLAPSRLDNTTKSEIALNEMQKLYQETGELNDGLMEDYLSKYAYKTMHWGTGKILEKGELTEMIIEETDLRGNTAEAEMKERNKKREKIIKELNLNQREVDFLSVARDYGFYRNYRADMADIVVWKSQELMRKFAHEKKIDFDDILFYTFEELFGEKFVDEKEVKKRKSLNFLGVFSLETGFYITTDKEKIAEYQEFMYPKQVEKVDLIKGNVASRGFAKGLVKKMNSAGDINKVEEGDILVTSMTMPNYLPAMKKATAFVTDEGGVTCHAAIISREMNKPCIIGTGNATQVLKDGDLVEVDAEKGEVRVLEKA